MKKGNLLTLILPNWKVEFVNFNRISPTSTEDETQSYQNDPKNVFLSKANANLTVCLDEEHVAFQIKNKRSEIPQKEVKSFGWNFKAIKRFKQKSGPVYIISSRIVCGSKGAILGAIPTQVSRGLMKHCHHFCRPKKIQENSAAFFCVIILPTQRITTIKGFQSLDLMSIGFHQRLPILPKMDLNDPQLPLRNVLEPICWRPGAPGLRGWSSQRMKVTPVRIYIGLYLMVYTYHKVYTFYWGFWLSRCYIYYIYQKISLNRKSL